MRNIYFFCGALLLVDGVFGDDETVSVVKGDSVTLNPDPELKQGDSAQWLFDGRRIADMSKAVLDVDERFKDRLNLDQTTGSLTITDIRTVHAGDYKLHISGDTETPDRIFSVTVSDNVKSVLEGDPVTLHTGFTGIEKDQIQWKFGDPGVLIADLNGAADASWSNTYLNDKTGDLTIRNIQKDQYGNYEVKIKNKNSLIFHRKLRIRTHDVFGDDVILSVMKGDSVTLYPHTEIPEDDTALWLFGGKIIAKINKAAGLFSTSEGDKVGFNGKLNLDHQNGSLTITSTTTKDTGIYKLQIRSTTETFRIFSVTVTDSRSSGSVSGISGASVGLMLWAVTVFLLHEV